MTRTNRRPKKSTTESSPSKHIHKQQQRLGEQNKESQSRLPNPDSAPWLIFRHRKHQKLLALYSVPEAKNYARSMHELRQNSEFEYLPSPQGWMLMRSRSSGDCFLLNPISTARVVLPPLERDFNGCLGKFVMSAAPTSNKCNILFLVADERNCLLFCNVNDLRWVKHYLRHIDDEEDTYILDIVACNEKFYGLTSSSWNIVLIDPDTPSRLEVSSLISTKPAMPPGSGYSRSQLLESCGEVYLIYKKYVYTSKVVSYILVYKMDLDNKVWEEMVDSFCAGDRVFFISEGCSGSCSASQKKMKGNRIYFLEDEDPRLYAYDMDDQSISICLPCPNLQSPWSPPIWLMPPI